jgi:hypothetical protein
MQARMLPKAALALVMLLAIALASCNLPVATQQGDDLTSTLAYQTVEAQLTMVAVTLPPPFTDTPPATLPSPATFTATPTATPVYTPTATPIPCDRAAFVTDVTVPDGSDYLPGATFSKTWRLRNNGSCTWTSGYALVFDSGDAMGGPASQQLTTGTVAPGATIDISVNLTAPATEGTFRGNWKLRNSSGVVFGIGPTAANPFWVEIEVFTPTSTPTPVGPNYVLSFENTHICQSTLTYATFRVGNTGSAAFEYASLNIVDLTSSGTLYNGTSNSPFMGTANDCPPGASSMGPGSVYYVAANIGSPPPSGHSARLNLRLCTQDSGAGTCVDKSVDFTTP